MLPRHHLLTAILMTAALGASAAEPVMDHYELKDGSMLYLRPDGTMTMVDARGRPMKMKNGVTMELKDGRMLMMKNQRGWIQIGPPGKGVGYFGTQ